VAEQTIRSAPPARQLELDLLRLVAALMVVACHYLSGPNAKNRIHSVAGAIYDWGTPLADMASLGSLGVDIFFMISGYVIAMSAQHRSARAFLASRAARLLPAFWCCCLLTWLLIRLDPAYRTVTVGQLVANLFLVARPLGHEFVDGVYWSLVIEVRFYLMVALLLWWFGMRRFVWFLALWLASALIEVTSGMPGALRVLVLPQFAPYFVAGGALCLIGRGQRVGLAYGLFTVALVLACTATAGRLSPIFEGQELVAAGMLCVAAFVLWLIATGRLARLGRPWMQLAGALTFPLYLLHEDLGFLVMRHFPLTGVGWIDHRLTITLVALALFLGLSYVVVTWVEGPLAPRIRRALSASAARPSPVLKEEIVHG